MSPDPHAVRPEFARRVDARNLSRARIGCLRCKETFATVGALFLHQDQAHAEQCGRVGRIVEGGQGRSSTSVHRAGLAIGRVFLAAVVVLVTVFAVAAIAEAVAEVGRANGWWK